MRASTPHAAPIAAQSANGVLAPTCNPLAPSRRRPTIRCTISFTNPVSSRATLVARWASTAHRWAGQGHGTHSEGHAVSCQCGGRRAPPPVAPRGRE
eukprot:1177121-Prymnesium_polylepis.2